MGPSMSCREFMEFGGYVLAIGGIIITILGGIVWALPGCGPAIFLGGLGTLATGGAILGIEKLTRPKKQAEIDLTLADPNGEQQQERIIVTETMKQVPSPNPVGGVRRLAAIQPPETHESPLMLSACAVLGFAIGCYIFHRFLKPCAPKPKRFPLHHVSNTAKIAYGTQDQRVLHDAEWDIE